MCTWAVLCMAGPCGLPWALVGPPAPVWARPLLAPLGACGPPWVLVCSLGPCGPLWALAGQALDVYIYA